jgi:hypothetical protein
MCLDRAFEHLSDAHAAPELRFFGLDRAKTQHAARMLLYAFDRRPIGEPFWIVFQKQEQHQLQHAKQ